MLQLFARFLPQRKQARFLAIWFLFEYQSVRIEFEDIHHNIQVQKNQRKTNSWWQFIEGKITEIKNNLFFHLADALEGLPPLRDIALRHYSASSAIALRQQY